MDTLSPEAVLADGFVFLEGPRWHKERIWLSDMHGHRVYTLTLAGEREQIAEVPGQPSGLGFLPDGTVQVVSMTDRRLLRLGADGPVEAADISGLVRGHINDMVMDREGNAYIGSFGFDLHAREKFQTANIVRVTPDGEARVVAEDMRFPNGMAITPDGAKLICAETFGRRLTIFNIRSDGGLANRRIFAEIPDSSPDGICLDQAGAVWVADFNRDVYLRVEDRGRITHQVPVPGRHAVACQLGGVDGCTLFLLTVEGTLDDAVARKSHARVEVLHVSVPGAGSP